ncbi:MAG: Y-family DNA polymerase [Bacteroidales bacterium]|jgi:DNA polymerase V|nr:Y-family DNA polymerase [Bacteroidales bacterium]MDD4213310.1 Y-family DNA polymerase [Bacteroidales bacterium]
MNSTKPNKTYPESAINKVFALVDCNNFYASCERVFNPKLEKKPVIVLSNNDGCVIARSNEAKLLGIKMGAPAFEFKSLIEKNKVHVFSSNFALYGDISNRVMNILYDMAPDVEIYSVDEAFLDLSSLKNENISAFAKKIRITIKQWAGIPVSVGVAPTKTLAKIANHLAKKNSSYANVMNFWEHDDTDNLLKHIPVTEIWGVGRAYGKFLQNKGITTVFDFKQADEPWVRKHMGVTGARTWMELRGVSCLPLNMVIPDKQSICTSRSFGKTLENYEDIEQATATFVSRAAEKLRQQYSCARSVNVFVMTNRFSDTPKYVNSIMVQLPVASNITSELVHYSLKGLKKIFCKGYKYKKSGIILSDLIPENQLQYSLWDDTNRRKMTELMRIVDNINKEVGQDAVKLAVQGTRRKWKMHQERLSPQYTSRWSDILTIKI